MSNCSGFVRLMWSSHSIVHSFFSLLSQLTQFFPFILAKKPGDEFFVVLFSVFFFCCLVSVYFASASDNQSPQFNDRHLNMRKMYKSKAIAILFFNSFDYTYVVRILYTYKCIIIYFIYVFTSPHKMYGLSIFRLFAEVKTSISTVIKNSFYVCFDECIYRNILYLIMHV